MFKSYLALILGIVLSGCSPSPAKTLVTPVAPPVNVEEAAKPAPVKVVESRAVSGDGWSLELPASFTVEEKDEDTSEFDLLASDDKTETYLLLYTTDFDGNLAQYVINSLRQIRTSGLRPITLKKIRWQGKEAAYLEVVKDEVQRRAHHWAVVENGKVINFACVTPDSNLEENRQRCTSIAGTMKFDK